MVLKEICCENEEINVNVDDLNSEIKILKEADTCLEETDKCLNDKNNGGTISGNITINIDNIDYKEDTYIYIDDLELDLYKINNLNEIVQSIKTNEQGFYEFKNIPSDDYIIKVNTPMKYKLYEKNDNSLINEKSLMSDKINNENDVNIPIKFKKVFEIKGIVFLDKPKTSIYGKESVGINGIKIFLYDENDNLIKETKSNKFLSIDGYFEFTNLESQIYKVVVNTEDGIDFSSPRYNLEYGSKASKNFSGIKCNLRDHDLTSAYIGLIYNN